MAGRLKTEYSKVKPGKMRCVTISPGVAMDATTDEPLGLGLMVIGAKGADTLVHPLRNPEEVAEFLIAVTTAAGIAFSTEAVDAALVTMTNAKSAEDASAESLPN